MRTGFNLLIFMIVNIMFVAGGNIVAQEKTLELAMNETNIHTNTFSNSESSEFSFIVRSNVKENELWVETNYRESYKVRFIDYYARTSKVFKNMHLDNRIDLSELNRSIFIVKFVDQDNKKVLSSQILNLKKDVYETQIKDNEPSFHRRQKF